VGRKEERSYNLIRNLFKQTTKDAFILLDVSKPKKQNNANDFYETIFL
jgi:hypothetical protein